MRECGVWKGMRGLVHLCLFLSVSCAADEGKTLSDREKAMRVAESTAFYYDSKGTPAEFAANRYLRLVNERRVLLKQKVLTEEEAVRRLAEYYDDVQLGRNWKVKREVLQIPELPCAPSLDADFRRGGWIRPAPALSSSPTTGALPTISSPPNATSPRPTGSPSTPR